MKFVCQFVLIFGACFELPVVVMALVKLDVLNYKVMKTTRAWAAIIICVVAAVITPTQDVLTLGLLAVPMYVLYEICIWLAWWLEKRDRALYPEYYKSIEDDEKAIAATDDWDNESYNPWSDDDDADELRPSSRPAPSGTQPMTDPAPDTLAEAHAGEGGDTAPQPGTEESHTGEWGESPEDSQPAKETPRVENTGATDAPADETPAPKSP